MNNLINKMLNIGRMCCVIFGIFCFVGSIILMYGCITQGNSEYFFTSVTYSLCGVMMLLAQYIFKISNVMINDMKRIQEIIRDSET